MNFSPIVKSPIYSLSAIVPRAQKFLAEVLAPGDLVVDLTAGNGYDTLFLAQCVGSGGKVISFDLQLQALESAAQKLAGAGIDCLWHTSPPAAWQQGVHLVHAGHDRLQEFVAEPPMAVIANLGYLPGGDKNIVTTPESTVMALSQAASIVAVGGRISVVVYAGHAGGATEAARVDQWFTQLSPDAWNILQITVKNRPEAPFLLVAEKRQ